MRNDEFIYIVVNSNNIATYYNFVCVYYMPWWLSNMIFLGLIQGLRLALVFHITVIKLVFLYTKKAFSVIVKVLRRHNVPIVFFCFVCLFLQASRQISCVFYNFYLVNHNLNNLYITLVWSNKLVTRLWISFTIGSAIKTAKCVLFFLQRARFISLLKPLLITIKNAILMCYFKCFRLYVSYIIKLFYLIPISLRVKPFGW